MSPICSESGTAELRGWWIVASIAALIFAATATAITISLGGHEQRADFVVGDCVSLSADPSGELKSTHTSCAMDISFTIGAVANDAGNCVPDQFDRFRAPFADAMTERLCLVPNLLVGHCYRFGVPVGMLDPADCGVGGPAVFRVTKRIDVYDVHACPDEKYKYAMAYPARTYCTETLP